MDLYANGGRQRQIQMNTRERHNERERLVALLTSIIGSDYVLHREQDRLLYEYDGSISRRMPDIVVLPKNPVEIAEIVKAARSYDVPIVARGSGTGLSGNAIPLEGGIVLSTSRMNQILEMDFRNRQAVVEPGVVNLNLSKAAMAGGF